MHRKTCPYCVRYYGYPESHEIKTRVSWHDKEECPVYNKYLKSYIEQTIDHRRKTYQHMLEFGFGIGTMIRTRYTVGVSLWWVLEIEWSLIYPARFNGGDQHNYLNSLINCPIRCATMCNSNSSNFVTPYTLDLYKMPESAYHYYDVVSPSGMPPLPPAGFYSTASCSIIAAHYLQTM